jgi:hypothetical protein
VDREDNRELSEEDRNILIDRKYNEWLEDLKMLSVDSIGAPGLTDEIQLRVIKELSKG